jgi:tetratricopeptide (TPR) repeat protein
MRLDPAACESGLKRVAPAWLLFCLGCSVLAMLLAPVGAFAENTCVQDPGVKKLIQAGSDVRRSYQERKHDYWEALRLCRQSTLAYDGLSILLVQHQDFEAAIQSIRGGLKVVPNDPSLTADLAMVELSAGRPQEALQVLSKLPSTAKIEFYRGLAYRALRDDRAAQKSFSISFEMGYEDPYVLYALIEEDHALGDHEAGLQHFNIFSQRYANSPWLHILLGNAYASRQDVANAEAEFKQSLDLDPDLPMVHYALGRLAFDRGDYLSAEADFRKEIELDATFGEAYLYLGVTLRREGKNADALSFLEKAAARDPNFALTYTELAATQTQLHKLQEALDTLQVAKQHFPDEAAFPAQRSTLLYRLGQQEEAKKESALAESLSAKGNPQRHDAPDPKLSLPAQGQEAATPTAGMASSAFSSSSKGEQREEHPTIDVRVDRGLDPLKNCLARAEKECAIEAFSKLQDPKLMDRPEYLDLSAQVLSLEGKKTDALAAIDQAIKMEPRQATYLITQGQIYQRSRDQVRAIHSFLQAAQLRPGWVEPAYSLGMSFFMLGNEDNNTEYYDRGARHFKVALELDPNCHKAEFMLGVVDAMENRLGKAKGHFETALKMSPQNPYYLVHYGILLKELGDSDGALREMEIAETLDHANPLTYFNLGLLESELQKYAEARKQLETAVQLDSKLAAAYYCLGGVYHHLGLADLSRAAYLKFQNAKALEQEEQTDPVEAAFSSSDSRTSTPK